MLRNQSENIVQVLAGGTFSKYIVLNPAIHINLMSSLVGVCPANRRNNIKMKINGPRHISHAAVNH